MLDDPGLPMPASAPLGLSEAAALLARRAISSAELLRSHLDRIAALDPQLSSVLLLTAEAALARAHQIDAAMMAGEPLGPLAGIPIGLKDIICTAKVRTTGHSRTRAYTIPAEDAHCAGKLFDAGAILLGKLATHEFAHGGPSFDLPWPPARNPWNTAHFTGGSSSGSGAAVAAGLVCGALGTDTGGSIRLPAALCGIVGLKPSYGLVSRRGVYPNSFTFDHVGPMTWTVEDCASMLAGIAGFDAADPASARVAIPDYREALTGDIRGVRVGVVRHFHEEDIPTDPAVIKAFEQAEDVLRALGATLQDVRLRPAKHYSDVKITIAESELFNVHADMLRTRPGDFGEDFLGRVLGAVLISGADYMEAQRERRLMLEEFESAYQSCDVLITPTAPAPAPKLGLWRTEQFWQKASFTTPFNVSGGPALSLCMGFDRAGLPLALQIAGRPFDEATVLRVAHSYEQATPWRHQRPALTPGATAPALPPVPDPASDLPAAERAMVADACRRAGLSLSERQLEMVCVAAPHVEAMISRTRRTRRFQDEPANTFRLPHPN